MTSENGLGGEGGFDKAREDGVVADLRRDHFIDGEQGTLTKVGFLRVGVRISRRCARGFAIKVGGIVVATTIDNLRGTPGEQYLSAFRTVNHVELAFSLRTDDALLNAVVVSNGKRRSQWLPFVIPALLFIACSDTACSS